MSRAARSRADACPGVLAMHAAADGALARVRLPGGGLGAERLRTLARCATEFGDGELHLTSRGNIQLRGLDAEDTRIAAALVDAGLLPAPGHERVRNVLASPAAASMRVLAGELDRRLCAMPILAGLPGRFLFAFDAGAGDIVGERADLCWHGVGDDLGALLIGGTDHGIRIGADRAVGVMLAAAAEFVRIRGDDAGAAWRIVELPGAGERIADVIRAEFPCVRTDSRRFPESAPVSLGLSTSDSGMNLVVAPPLGTLTADQAELLAEVAPGPVVLTPWRSLLLTVPGGRGEALRTVLAGAGFLTSPEAPLAGVSACAGRPGCAKSLSDVRAEARRAAATGITAHFAGCERRCGRPHGDHSDVLAVPGGYQVDGVVVRQDELADTLRSKKNSMVLERKGHK